jgi:N-acetylglutamate synthase-like GNAT family acetyltransferase
VPFPSHLERPIREVIDVDVLACQLVCQFTALQDNLPSVVRKGKLLAEVTLLAMAEDVGQARSLHVQPAMQVLGLRWRKRELLVEALHELRQEGVASIYVGDVCQAQLLY